MQSAPPLLCARIRLDRKVNYCGSCVSNNLAHPYEGD